MKRKIYPKQSKLWTSLSMNLQLGNSMNNFWNPKFAILACTSPIIDSLLLHQMASSAVTKMALERSKLSAHIHKGTQILLMPARQTHSFCTLDDKNQGQGQMAVLYFVVWTRKKRFGRPTAIRSFYYGIITPELVFPMNLNISMDYVS